MKRKMICCLLVIAMTVSTLGWTVPVYAQEVMSSEKHEVYEPDEKSVYDGEELRRSEHDNEESGYGLKTGDEKDEPFGDKKKLNDSADNYVKPVMPLTFPRPINQIFPDPVLAEIVAQQIFGSSANADLKVSQTQLEARVRLEILNMPIQNLEGMQYFTNLTHLTIFSGRISDLQPLANLINLTNLNLSANQISDLQPLANLINLTNLGLSNNQISDLQPLVNLTNLTNLGLSYNRISDLQTLLNLTNLTSLRLSSNPISDIQPLANLTNLIDLSFGNNPISDIQPLANLTNLTSLSFWGTTQINDLQPLANLTNLTNFQLSGSQVSDIQPLAGLTNLTDLNLPNNRISDLQPLANLTNLVGGVLMWQQHIILPSVPLSNPLLVENNVLNIDGSRITPSHINDNGIYASPYIAWAELSVNTTEVTYSFFQNVTIGNTTSLFSGTVTQPISGTMPSVTIIWNPNGGTVNPTIQLAIPGNAIGTLPIPTRSGFTFVGWYTTSAATGGTRITETTPVPNNNVIYWARWTPNNVLLNGWHQVEGGNLAFYQNGVRVGLGSGINGYFAADLQTPHGIADFFFNNQGHLVRGLVSYGGAWHYFDTIHGTRHFSGVSGWWGWGLAPGQLRYLNADGTWAANELKTIIWNCNYGGLTQASYLFDANGFLVTDFEFDLAGGLSVHSAFGEWHVMATHSFNRVGNFNIANGGGWLQPRPGVLRYLFADGTYLTGPATVVNGQTTIPANQLESVWTIMAGHEFLFCVDGYLQFGWVYMNGNRVAYIGANGIRV